MRLKEFEVLRKAVVVTPHGDESQLARPGFVFKAKLSSPEVQRLLKINAIRELPQDEVVVDKKEETQKVDDEDDLLEDADDIIVVLD